MDEALTFSTAPDVEAALLSPTLIPPPAPATIGDGSMAALRDQMARFSGPDEHGPRRAAVDAVAAQLNEYPFAAQAHRRAALALATASADDIGLLVPVEIMAAALGVGESEVAAVRSDVAAVAAVIGRQEPTTADADAAATRLLDRFGVGDQAVAAVSMLYQTHDATAALFDATRAAASDAVARKPAVTRTMRIAVADTTIAGQAASAGTDVVVDLGQAGFEFGAGAHHCPGRSFAERIVAGMMSALATE